MGMRYDDVALDDKAEKNLEINFVLVDRLLEMLSTLSHSREALVSKIKLREAEVWIEQAIKRDALERKGEEPSQQVKRLEAETSRKGKAETLAGDQDCQKI